jgi:hypothetical protein
MAMRRPPRVITMVSPLSAPSKAAEKLRATSDADISFMRSDYLIQVI